MSSTTQKSMLWHLEMPWRTSGTLFSSFAEANINVLLVSSDNNHKNMGTGKHPLQQMNQNVEFKKKWTFRVTWDWSDQSTCAQNDQSDQSDEGDQSDPLSLADNCNKIPEQHFTAAIQIPELSRWWQDRDDLQRRTRTIFDTFALVFCIWILHFVFTFEFQNRDDPQRGGAGLSSTLLHLRTALAHISVQAGQQWVF